MDQAHRRRGVVLVRLFRQGISCHSRLHLQLSDRDLAHLGDVVNKAKAKASALGEGDVLQAARSLLKESRDLEVPDFIRERLDKLQLLIQMLEDKVWELSGEDRARITNALAYFADPDDIIPDDVPGFGLLDDAVVIDLACQELRHDIEAYEDFCKFRDVGRSAAGQVGRSDVARAMAANPAGTVARSDAPSALGLVGVTPGSFLLLTPVLPSLPRRLREGVPGRGIGFTSPMPQRLSTLYNALRTSVVAAPI